MVREKITLGSINISSKYCQYLVSVTSAKCKFISDSDDNTGFQSMATSKTDVRLVTKIVISISQRNILDVVTLILALV